MEKFAHFFKPDVQKAGSDLITKDRVYLQLGSDTQVDASVRGTTPEKVAFRTASIGDKTVTVTCTCKASQKGSLCKHIWATLLLVEERSSDFLDSKTEIEKGSGVTAARKPQVSEAQAQSRAEAKEKFAEKQSEYRKQAYQVQKARAKDLKAEKKETLKSASRSKSKSQIFSPELPDDLRTALAYFDQNGFPMTAPVDEASVNNAKRVLSRVFHPDKGGTHQEILDLLHHSKVLLSYR